MSKTLWTDASGSRVHTNAIRIMITSPSITEITLTTKRQANIAQQMLEAGHRPYLSIDFDIAGTGERPTRDFVRLQPSFENHGAVPATVIGWRFAARDGGHLVGEQDQTRGEDVLAIFPHRKEDAKPITVQGEDAARFWESSEFLIFEASVEYRGVYERRYATTTVFRVFKWGGLQRRYIIATERQEFM